MTSRSSDVAVAAPGVPFDAAARPVLRGIVEPQALASALARLRRAGVVPGAIVDWLGHNRIDMLATLAACEQLGAVLLPLNWRLTAAELTRIIGHAGPHTCSPCPRPGLLEDAVLGSLQAAEIIGAAALLCHAIDDEARGFYVHHGFVESPMLPLTLMLGLRQRP